MTTNKRVFAVSASLAVITVMKTRWSVAFGVSSIRTLSTKVRLSQPKISMGATSSGDEEVMNKYSR